MLKIILSVLVALGIFQCVHTFPASTASSQQADGDSTKTASVIEKLDPKRVWLKVGPGKESEKSAESQASSLVTPEAETSSPKEKEDDKVQKNDNKKATAAGNESVEKKKPVDVSSSKTKTDDVKTPAVPMDNNNKCQSIRCSPPPGGADCSETTAPPTFAIALPERPCCPVHSCRREDGSIYYHYGLEMDAPQTEGGYRAPASLSSISSQPNQFPQPILAANPLTPIYSAPAQQRFVNLDSGVARQAQANNPGAYYYPQQGPGSQNGILYPFQGSTVPQQFLMNNNNNRFVAPAAGSAQSLPGPAQSQYAPFAPGLGGSGVDANNNNAVNRLPRPGSPSNFNFGEQPQVASFSGGYSSSMQTQYASANAWSPRPRRNAYLQASGGFGILQI